MTSNRVRPPLLAGSLPGRRRRPDQSI